MSATAIAAAVHPRRRWGWTSAALAVLAAFLVLGLLADAFAPAPSGPAGSAYATTPAGVAAWAELLARAGHPVGVLRVPLSDARPPAGSTLVVLEVQSLTRAQAERLDAFVRGGGRLIVGASDPRAAVSALLTSPPAWSPSGATLSRPLANAPEVAGVAQVRSLGTGAWQGGSGTVALLGGPDGSLLDAANLGAGRILALADASPLENGLLGSADNAQLALNLAGPRGRPVQFAESPHGYGQATGLAAFPTRWWALAIGLALAGGLWVLARGRRLGPAEQAAAPAVPARSAYVDAVAAALVRARDRDALNKLPAPDGPTETP